MHTQTCYIDLTPGAVNQVVHVSQYDTGAHTLEFILVENGGTLTPDSGSVILLSGVKPDLTSFSYRGTISGFIIKFPCTQQMTNVAGDVTCELSITTSQGVVGTANFVMNVEKSPLEKVIASHSEIVSLAPLVSAAQNAAADAQEAAAALDSITAVTRIDTGSANLNDYTSNGTWYAPVSVATNANSKNFPHPKVWDANVTDSSGEKIGGWVDSATTYAGWLHVIASSGYVKQLYYVHGTINSSDHYLWEREFNGTAWGPWYRLLTEQEVTNTISDSIYKLPTMSAVYRTQELAKGKAPTSHADETTRYGAATTTMYGHVKVVDVLDSSSVNGTALSARAGKALDEKIATQKSRIDSVIENKAPKNHASDSTDFGIGTGLRYGHCMVINSLNASSYEAGKALAAYQGYLLDQRVTSNSNRLRVLDTVLSIGESKDLNSLDFGMYFSSSNDITKTLSHRPSGVTGLFTIRVTKYGWDGVWQELDYPLGNCFFYRVKSSSTADFSKWRKVVGTEVDYAAAN